MSTRDLLSPSGQIPGSRSAPAEVGGHEIGTAADATQVADDPLTSFRVASAHQYVGSPLSQRRRYRGADTAR